MLNQRLLLILGAWIGFSAQTFEVFAGGDDDLSIKFLRAFFDEDSSKPAKIWSKELANKVEFSNLKSLVGKFKPKDIWGNRDFIFGYGTQTDGSLIMFAWHNSEDAEKINLKDLSGIYTDERMAQIQDEADLKKWKKMRELVAGAFIALRRGESTCSYLLPKTKQDEKVAGRQGISSLVLDSQPIVIRFASVNAPKRNTVVAEAPGMPNR